MHSNKFNKILSSLLAMAMMFSSLLIPSVVFADDELVEVESEEIVEPEETVEEEEDYFG